MQGYFKEKSELYKHRIHGKLGLQLSFRWWVFKEKSNQMYPVMGEKQMSKRVRWDQRLQNFQRNQNVTLHLGTDGCH